MTTDSGINPGINPEITEQGTSHTVTVDGMPIH